MTNAGTVDPLLVTSFDQMLRDLITPEVLRDAERHGWAAELWRSLVDHGAPWVGVPVDAGGSGGTWADALAIVRLCGAHACPLPIAETGMLGGSLLAGAGLDLPLGPVTVVPGMSTDSLTVSKGRLSGRAHNVPWASAVDSIVAIVGDLVVVAPRGTYSCVSRRNLAGEPRETVDFDGVVASAPCTGVANPETLKLRGALARGAAMAGAIASVAALSTRYANDRQQFGRPIATFQAVASHLVQIVGEAQVARMAFDATVAAATCHEHVEDAVFQIASFKVLAGESSTRVAKLAHQVHGAIGMTQEYGLQHLTRRLWAWREEFGSTRSWQAVAGRQVVEAGPGRVWDLLTVGNLTD